jgi:hypothetical protein
MINKTSRFKQKAKSYRNLIQKRLLSLQALNCQSDKKLLCEYKEECDFSCLIHFITMCFVKGYYLNRRVVLAGSGYLDNLEKYFLPLHKNCNNNSLTNFIDIGIFKSIDFYLS